MVNRETTNESMLHCEAVWREISNYVDGDVDAGLRVKMDEHFRSCARCASVLAGTRNVVTLYGDERMLEVPAGFSQRLEARLEQKRLEHSAQGSSEQKTRKRAEKYPVWSVGSAAQWSTWSAWMMPAAALVLFVGAIALVDQMAYRPPAKSPMAEQAHGIPPDMMVVVSAGSKVFHVAGCEFIHDKNTERTITAKQAMQDGYVPCTRCLREYITASLTERLVVEADKAEAEEEQEDILGSKAH